MDTQMNKVIEKHKSGKRKGFSLVEILIVLVILAVISGGGMMIAGKSSDKAKFVTAQKDLDVIQQAFVQYYNVTGTFDGITAGNLSASLTGNYKAATTRLTVFQSFIGKPLASWLDPWGAEYQIATNYNTATGQGVIAVYCTGAGGLSNTVGTLTVTPVRSDTTSKSSGTESPMFRVIYNVTF